MRNISWAHAHSILCNLVVCLIDIIQWDSIKGLEKNKVVNRFSNSCFFFDLLPRVAYCWYWYWWTQYNELRNARSVASFFHLIFVRGECLWLFCSKYSGSRCDGFTSHLHSIFVVRYLLYVQLFGSFEMCSAYLLRLLWTRTIMTHWLHLNDRQVVCHWFYDLLTNYLFNGSLSLFYVCPICIHIYLGYAYLYTYA